MLTSFQVLGSALCMCYLLRLIELCAIATVMGPHSGDEETEALSNLLVSVQPGLQPEFSSQRKKRRKEGREGRREAEKRKNRERKKKKKSLDLKHLPLSVV